MPGQEQPPAVPGGGEWHTATPWLRPVIRCLDRTFGDRPAAPDGGPGARLAWLRRLTVLAAGTLYIHLAPFGPPAMEGVTLLVFVAVVVASIGLLGSRARRGENQHSITRSGLALLIFGFFAFATLVFSPALSRPWRAAWIADDIDGTVTRTYRVEGLHDMPVVDVTEAGGGVDRHRVLEPTWRAIAVGDRVVKRRGSSSARVNGEPQPWAPVERLCGVDPHRRSWIVSLLFCTSVLALLWVAGSLAWVWLRRTGPLRLAGEVTTLTAGTIVGFGRPEIANEALRENPWRPLRGRYRWRYEFDADDPAGNRRTYRGGEPVSRRCPAGRDTAMTVGRPATIRYAVGDPTRSKLLQLL